MVTRPVAIESLVVKLRAELSELVPFDLAQVGESGLGQSLNLDQTKVVPQGKRLRRQVSRPRWKSTFVNFASRRR